MDRRIRGVLALTGLGLTLAMATGCHHGFGRRGIPPEPGSLHDGPAGFGSDPSPAMRGMGTMNPNAPGGRGGAVSPYGSGEALPDDTPLPQNVPGITNPGNAVDEPGVMGAPGMPPSPL